MSNSVLLVVDVQTALIEGHPYNEQNVVLNIKRLISAARDNGKEVIYVRHDDGKGGELEYGNDEFYNYTIWNKRFASILSVDEVISIMEGSLDNC
jgi:nicotinamidase-related amidase